MLMRPEFKNVHHGLLQTDRSRDLGTDKWTLRFSPFKLDYKEY